MRPLHLHITGQCSHCTYTSLDSAPLHLHITGQRVHCTYTSLDSAPTAPTHHWTVRPLQQHTTDSRAHCTNTSRTVRPLHQHITEQCAHCTGRPLHRAPTAQCAHYTNTSQTVRPLYQHITDSAPTAPTHHWTVRPLHKAPNAPTHHGQGAHCTNTLRTGRPLHQHITDMEPTAPAHHRTATAPTHHCTFQKFNQEMQQSPLAGCNEANHGAWSTERCKLNLYSMYSQPWHGRFHTRWFSKSYGSLRECSSCLLQWTKHIALLICCKHGLYAKQIITYFMTIINCIKSSWYNYKE